MILRDGEKSELIVYLAGLYQKKQLREVTIDSYAVKYSSCVIIDSFDSNETHESMEFPEPDEKDRIKSISIRVSGLNGSGSNMIHIDWDSVSIEPDVHPRLAREFIDVLDRSTFRYF